MTGKSVSWQKRIELIPRYNLSKCKDSGFPVCSRPTSIIGTEYEEEQEAKRFNVGLSDVGLGALLVTHMEILVNFDNSSQKEGWGRSFCYCSNSTPHFSLWVPDTFKINK